MTSIGLGAFFLCESLTYINIPEGVTSIGESAFAYCSGLTSINIPKSMTKIEDNVFQGCSNLTSIDIPESVTSIGQVAFGGCVGLTSINIPENVTSIGWNAFEGCIGLTIIIIPKSVTSIGDNVVVGCASLRDIYCMGYTPADVSNLGGWNNDIEENCTLHVPYGAIDRYKTADGWKEFANIVEFDPTGVEAVSADGKSVTEQQIYNLGGARMTAPQRGLNIINGKKVVY